MAHSSLYNFEMLKFIFKVMIEFLEILVHFPFSCFLQPSFKHIKEVIFFLF